MATLVGLMVVLPLYFLLMRLWSPKRKRGRAYIPPPGVKVVRFPSLRSYAVTFDPDEDADIIKYVNSLYAYVPHYLQGLAKRAAGEVSAISLSDCFEPGMRNLSIKFPETETLYIDKANNPKTVAYLDGLPDVGIHVRGLVREDMGRAIAAGAYDGSLSETDHRLMRTDRALKRYLESA